jgi:hypothetical protein
MMGGRLLHCRYCRVQFYDRRPRASEVAEEPVEAQPAEPQRQEAGGDA